MSNDEGLITRLCEQWEDARARGETVTPEDLCRDHPALLDEVRQAIHHLSAANRAVAPPARPPVPELPPLPPGCRYRLVEFLAQGGLGRVYAGEDLELGREVAVKFVRPDRTGTAALVRFRWEAEITGRLEHPGVVPVYGLVELADGGFCYAMRLLRGETLSSAIDRLPAATHEDRPAALRKLLRHFIAVCDTVAFAHSRNVLHRDLKPANVMLGEFGETWVLDWGLAKRLDTRETTGGVDPSPDDTGSLSTPPINQTVPGAAVGTPGFMSPEQARGDLSVLGPRSDIYSLGATLGAILTGKGPRPGQSVEKWLAGGPPALVAICMKAMAAEPEQRYADIRSLADDIERWLADEPVAVYRDPFPERARRWAKRNRTAVLALGALLLAAVPLSTALAAVSDRARRQAVNDQRRVEHEKEEADRQRDAALANFDLAFRVMDDTLGTITEDIAFRNPNLLPLRKGIETQLRSYFDDLATRYRDNPKLREYRAAALLNLGLIQSSEGQEDEARKSFAEAESLARRLVEESPDRPEYSARLAAIITAIAAQKSRTNAPDDLPAQFREAAALWQRAIAAQPDNVKWRIGQSSVRAALATDLIRTRHFTDAVKELEVAIKEAEENETRPGWPDRLGTLGNLRDLLAQAYRQGGQPREAEAAFRKAVEEHDRTLARYPGDVYTQQRRAVALLGLGQLYMQLAATNSANIAKAEDVLTAASRAFTRLAEENPTQWQFAHDIVLVHHYLAGLAEATDWSKAQARWVEAVAQADRYEKAFPEMPQFKVFRIGFQVKIANHDAAAQRTEQAIKGWTNAMREAAALLKDKVSTAASYSLRLNILEAGYGLGQLHTQAKRLDLAEPVLKTAVEAGREILGGPALDPAALGGLADTCILWGEVLIERKDFAGAVAAYTTGLEAAHRLPLAIQMSSGKTGLRMLYVGRANAHASLGQFPDEAADWEKAATVSSQADRSQAEFRRLLARLRANSTETAVAELDQQSVPTDATAELLYDIACVHAVAATVVAKADGLPPELRSKTAERYRERAVSLLRQVQATGFFKDRRAADHLKADAEMDSLRNRPDFMKLLNSINSDEKK